VLPPGRSPQSGAAAHAEHLSYKPLVLVIDDNLDARSLLTAILECEGYEVVSASSAYAALEEVQRERYNFIISDIGMPGMDGYELARRLRILPEYSTTPMIAVTGFPQYSAHATAINAGFNAHLEKPIEPAKLLEILARLLGNHRPS
jgi:CheY-like chemotaxis protein